MIFGVDHVALACGDIDEAAAALERIGCHAAFIERHLVNRETKARFLHWYQATHAIAYCAVPDSPAIELTGYGRVHRAPSPYEVLFSGPIDTADEADADDALAEIWRAATGTAHVGCGLLRSIGVRYWYDRTATGQRRGPRVRCVLRRVADLACATSFWAEAAGARRMASGSAGGARWARLAIGAALSQWSLELIVVESRSGVTDDEAPPRLDDTGFPCVALLTSNLQRERDRFFAAGAGDSTGTFAMTINHRRLSVEILRAPAGELIELIEVAVPSLIRERREEQLCRGSLI